MEVNIDGITIPREMILMGKALVNSALDQEIFFDLYKFILPIIFAYLFLHSVLFLIKQTCLSKSEVKWTIFWVTMVKTWFRRIWTWYSNYMSPNNAKGPFITMKFRYFQRNCFFIKLYCNPLYVLSLLNKFTYGIPLVTETILKVKISNLMSG